MQSIPRTSVVYKAIGAASNTIAGVIGMTEARSPSLRIHVRIAIFAAKRMVVIQDTNTTVNMTINKQNYKN